MISSSLWGFGEGKLEINQFNIIILKSSICEIFWRNRRVLSFSIESHLLDLGTITFFESAQPIFELTGNELRVFFVGNYMRCDENHQLGLFECG